ncbi:RNA-binding protein [Bradyrhizobium sp. 179]|nr:RNA-binding protein [Bradyrhizobium sp. 179]
MPEPGNSLLALGGLGLAGIAMLGWICALAWVAWRLVGWLLF